MKIKASVIVGLMSIFSIACTQNQKDMKSYVIEVTTFSYKGTINADVFWKRDAEIEANYTSKQPGYISRESGYSKDEDEVVVVVRWEQQADADASMKKFMTDESVQDFANMIDGSTMKMARYDVK